MPRKKRPAVTRASLDIPAELLEKWIPGPMDAAGVEAVFQRLKKAVIERALGAELGMHLAGPDGGLSNHRNGRSSKTLLTDEGPIRIDIPRDRAGTFEPQLIPKHERRFAGFDERIVSMYARGMTVREIQAHLAEMYAVEVSPEFISKVTDEVMGEVQAWQTRPLEPMYPVVFFDALRVKVREDGVVRNKAVYLALGVLADGTRDILGLWIENTEGAKFWMRVFNDLRTRGVEDILIGVADGLKGMSTALEAVFPQATLQTCIVHLIRSSLSYAGHKDRTALSRALRPIYTAPTAEVAEAELASFESSVWATKVPTVAPAWRRAWTQVVPFFAFPPDVRRIIYTTNAIESIHSRLRKIIKTRGHFPGDDAATKLIWLALRNITAEWRNPSIIWKAAMNQFAVIYGDRFTRPRELP